MPSFCLFFFLSYTLFISGFGGDKGQAIMMDCLENGDVIMNAFNANDCTGNDKQHSILENSSIHYLSSSIHYLKTHETINFDHLILNDVHLTLSPSHTTSQFRCTHLLRGACCCRHLLRLLLLPR